jgi:hypothetical protein
MRIGGDQGVDAYPEPLCNGEHGISWLDGVAALKSRRAGSWHSALRLLLARHTKHISGKNLAWIGNVGIGSDQRI